MEIMCIFRNINVKFIFLQNTLMRQDLQEQTGTMFSSLRESMMGKVCVNVGFYDKIEVEAVRRFLWKAGEFSMIPVSTIVI